MRAILLVFLLLMPVLHAQPPAIAMQPPPMAPGLENVGEWPSDLPLPSGDWHGHQSPSHFAASVSPGISLEELSTHWQESLAAHAWTLETVRMQPTLFIAATKGWRSVTLSAYEHRGGRFCEIQVVDNCQGNGFGNEDYVAQTVLDRMLFVYDAMQTYQDRGYSAWWMHREDDRVESEVEEFITHYTRESMRYEHVHPQLRFIVHKDEDGSRRYSSQDGQVRSVEDIARELEEQFSAPTASIVALLAGTEQPFFKTLLEPRIVGIEQVLGTPCMVLEADNAQCLPVRLWIGQEDSLLYRIEEWELRRMEPAFAQVSFFPIAGAIFDEELLQFDKRGRLPFDGPTLTPQPASTLENSRRRR